MKDAFVEVSCSIANAPAASVAQIVDETEAEGPGRRFALWVQGCPLRCAGCCNPHMLRPEGGTPMSVDALVARVLASVAEHRIEGVSLLGGEPFAQAEVLSRFAAAVRARGLSVMVFTGFELAELERRRATEPAVGALLDATDLLVDGPYDRERPESERRWIGSTNQVMHFLTDRYRVDDPRMRRSNTVEIRLRRSGDDHEVVVNGWPALAGGVLDRRALGRWERRR